VPIGPAARARAAQRDLDDGMPPAADAFWSEDAAALHDAVQAPAAGAGERLAPPVGLVPPVAGLLPARAIHLPRPGSFRRLPRLSWRPTLLASGAVALVVAAVIGASEGPASPRIANHPVSRIPSSFGLGASTDAAAADKAAAAGRSAHVVTRLHHGSRARTRAHARRTRVVKTHHRPVVHHSAGSSSQRTVAEAATSPAPVHSSGSSATTTPTASTASTVASTGSKPAAGPPGPTQIGKVTGGCLPKCQ
jgi:hypothetical protein